MNLFLIKSHLIISLPKKFIFFIKKFSKNLLKVFIMSEFILEYLATVKINSIFMSFGICKFKKLPLHIFYEESNLKSKDILDKIDTAESYKVNSMDLEKIKCLVYLLKMEYIFNLVKESNFFLDLNKKADFEFPCFIDIRFIFNMMFRKIKTDILSGDILEDKLKEKSDYIFNDFISIINLIEENESILYDDIDKLIMPLVFDLLFTFEPITNNLDLNEEKKKFIHFHISSKFEMCKLCQTFLPQLNLSSNRLIQNEEVKKINQLHYFSAIIAENKVRINLYKRKISKNKDFLLISDSILSLMSESSISELDIFTLASTYDENLILENLIKIQLYAMHSKIESSVDFLTKKSQDKKLNDEIHIFIFNLQRSILSNKIAIELISTLIETLVNEIESYYLVDLEIGLVKSIIEILIKYSIIKISDIIGIDIFSSFDDLYSMKYGLSLQVQSKEIFKELNSRSDLMKEYLHS